MGDVIDFPGQALQEWAGFEHTIRRLMKGLPPVEMQDEVVAQMKNFFLRHNLKFRLPIELPGSLSETHKKDILSSISLALKGFEQQIHGYTNRILMERLQVEIELYRLRHIPE